ncbi:MAG: cyanophycinase [Bacteroidales bacterium]
MNYKNIFSGILILSFLFSCQSPTKKFSDSIPKGKLYIIGGGKRPVEMIQEIISLSKLDKDGYIVVLPMSSSEPDTSFFYTKKQFAEQGITRIFNFHVERGETLSRQKLDSVKTASLIYIPGGEQVKFMETVLNTPLHEAIKIAYHKGTVIAGTSAGAAVMSKKMITGNEFKHPDYTGDFRTIEAENIEVLEGLGFLDKTIIDQHFVWRMRMNRLITVAIENPGFTCIGIDESTAIVVEGDSARVTGISQVIVIRSSDEKGKTKNGLLGKEGMELSVYLPNDVFSIK